MKKFVVTCCAAPAVFALGLAMIITGILIVLVPWLIAQQRGAAEAAAVQSWQATQAPTLAPVLAPASATPAPALVCGTGNAYALVTFSAPAAAHYAGVATDGTWDALSSSGMVHFTGTPAPGSLGNVMIGFHREPNYEKIDALGVGDTITVQDRACAMFTYRITSRQIGSPAAITPELQPTGEHNLTMVTCTPWWIDTSRIVWRAVEV